jgi:hypothetical protein
MTSRESSDKDSVIVEPLVPSEDFINLIAEGIAPERYGRSVELDSEDRRIWAEILTPRRRSLSAAIRVVVFDYRSLLIVGFLLLACALGRVLWLS